VFVRSSSYGSQITYLLTEFNSKQIAWVKVYEAGPSVNLKRYPEYRLVQEAMKSISIDTYQEYKKEHSDERDKVKAQIHEEKEIKDYKAGGIVKDLEDSKFGNEVSSEVYFIRTPNKNMNSKPTIVMLHGGPH